MAFDLNALSGRTVFDQDGSKLGSVGQVYLDDRSGDPTFVTVNMGLFGTKETFVPLEQATEGTDGLTVPYSKDFVKEAPHVDPEVHLDEPEQDRLLAYYHSNGEQATADTGRGGWDGADSQEDLARRNSDACYGTTDTVAAAGTVGMAGVAGTAGMASDTTATGDSNDWAATDRSSDQDHAKDQDRVGGLAGDDLRADASAGMVRHEEQVRVGTERVETGRVQLRKHIVTEQRTVTVPVSHEEVEIVREPIEGGRTGGELGEDMQEVTLSEERPVVQKDVIEAERIRLDRHEETERRDIITDVRHEEIELERDDATGIADGQRRDRDL